jgi:hypothetical protein
MNYYIDKNGRAHNKEGQFVSPEMVEDKVKLTPKI